MKLLFDLFPVIAFFITLKVTEKISAMAIFARETLSFLGIQETLPDELIPIMLATVVVILATLLQIIWVKLRHGRVDKMLWISAALVAVLGGLTLYLQNPAFIKWKPTLLYWVFAMTLLGAQVLWKKNLLKSMMGQEIKLAESVWRSITMAWIGFFIGMGFLNLYVAYHFSTDTWASFKLFGSLGLTFAFILLQAWWMQKHIQEE